MPGPVVKLRHHTCTHVLLLWGYKPVNTPLQVQCGSASGMWNNALVCNHIQSSGFALVLYVVTALHTALVDVAINYNKGPTTPKQGTTKL